MEIESVGTSLLIKAQHIEQKTDNVVNKKPTPSKVGTEKRIGNIIVTKTIKKSKQTPSSDIAKWDVYEISSKFIPMREWKLHLCSFYDHTRYSIWYGTKSYKWECITESEAIKRFKEALKWRVEKVQKDYPTLLPYQQSALVSLFYNCNSCYLRVGNTVEKWDFNRSSYIINKFPWLKKRTRAEQDLFFYWIIY